MSAVAGKDAKVSLGGTDITVYVDKAGSNQTADKNDVSTFGVGSKKYAPGLKDGTGSLEGPFDATVHASIAPMLGTQVAYVYQPAGAASGLPRATVQVIVTGYDVESDVSGNATIKGTLQYTGDLVWDVNP
jgi:hypothetical protein